jgi:5'-3' exonuclease
MIVIDFSHLSNPMMRVAWNTAMQEGTPFDQEFKGRVLILIKRVLNQHYRNADEVILCIDSPNNWRKLKFEYYKHSRKESRLKEGLDWDMVYRVQREFIEELKANFMFKVFQVPRMEADDLIAYIAHENMLYNKKFVLISSDKDFKQLHKYNNITQFNYKGEEIICESSPEIEREILILTGDSSDGIPNILSDDDALANKSKSQKRFGPVTALKLINGNPKTVEKYGDLDDIKLTDNYRRNKLLIDLIDIPEGIIKRIEPYFLNLKVSGNRMTIEKYLIHNFRQTNSNLDKDIISFVIGDSKNDTKLKWSKRLMEI